MYFFQILVFHFSKNNCSSMHDSKATLGGLFLVMGASQWDQMKLSQIF